MSKLIRNSLGMGLIEVMAAIAITGGLSLTISKLLENQSQGVKQTEAKSENMNLKGIIQETLNNTTACQYTFSPITSAQWTAMTSTTITTLPSIKDKLNNPKYSTASIDIAPLTITSIYLTNYNSGLSTGDLVIQSTFKRSSKLTQVVKPIKIPINFAFSTFPTLTGCSTMAVGGEWMLGGNAATTPGTDYLGTSDATDFVMKTNATERARISSAGNVGIGSAAPLSQLSVTNGTYTAGSYNSDGYATAAIFGYSDLSDGTAIFGRVKPIGDNTRQTGVRGDCVGPHVSAYCTGVWGVANYATTEESGRTYGVSGWNGATGTEGWNYATYGWLYGTKSGAAIYGSSDAAAGDSDVSEGVAGRRWAGYFRGNVKTTGTLAGGTSVASGGNSVALGTASTVSGQYAFSMGLQNVVSGRYGFANGFSNSVTAEAGIALGKGNIASGINSHAVGDINIASGLSSSAFGYYNTASGDYSLASGYNSSATGSISTAIGNTSVASGANSFAGGSSTASGSNSMAYGSSANSMYESSIALLGRSEAQYALAMGQNARAYGQFSTALGRSTITGAAATPNSTSVGYYATAIGPFAQATANYALALGAGTSGVSATASGTNSVAIGNSVTASGSQSLGAGVTITASGSRSLAIGAQIVSSGSSGAQSLGGNIYNSHAASTILGQNPWGTIFSRANNMTTIFGPSIEMCTATASGGSSPYWGDYCEASSAISISRAGSTWPFYARLGVGYRDTAYSLAVNCTGNALTCVGNSLGILSWQNSSDRRLKDVEHDYTRGLKEILNIKPVYYRYKDNEELGLSSERLNIGVIAQEVQPHFPEAITKDPKGYLVFQSDPILWGMVNAVKEQNSEIEKLKKENKDLKQALCELHPELKLCKIK